MHDHGTPSGVAVQRAVLSLVLNTDREPVRLHRIAAEVGQEAAEQAVSKLCEVGLLNREGESVTASAAAVHFDRLGL